MYSIPMINTYNESSLHKSLKNMICKECKGTTEKEIHSYICDVYTNDGKIIEIQTKNLGKLTAKILNLLQTHSVTVVYPLAVTSYIEYYGESSLDSKPLSRKKSPKSNNIYDIFDELMGVFPVLLKDHFKLRVIEVCITKERIKKDKRVQSVNKNRRFLKDWISYDTTLDAIFETKVFSTKDDYLDLLPKGLNETFCVNDVINKSSIKKQQAYKMIWTFEKMNILDYIGKKGRSKMYKITTI